MSQIDVFGLLRENRNKRFTAEELKKRLSVGVISIRRNLGQLRRYGLVKFKIKDNGKRGIIEYYYDGK